MSAQRRNFPDSFKREAVDSVANSGLSAGAVARELGLHETVLRRWMTQFGVQATGPNLLTGICFCGFCGGAMTLRTGKGQAGGQYRYYACSTKARMGEAGCTGLAVPMHKLDDAIVDHLETRLLDPERLAALMEQLLDRREEWADQRRSHIAEMRKRATEAEAKLNRLYEAIENGLLAPDDPSLKGRVAELSGIRDQASADANRISASVERLAPTITSDALARFATVARRKLRDRTSGYRRDHLRALTQRVEVISKTEARIIGSRTELLRALASSDGGSYAAAGGVLSFKPKWRAATDDAENYCASVLLVG